VFGVLIGEGPAEESGAGWARQVDGHRCGHVGCAFKAWLNRTESYELCADSFVSGASVRSGSGVRCNI
jgi:hypothetical protein